MWFLSSVTCFSQRPMHELRENMVRKQVQRRGVVDDLTLNAMRVVERHKFVPDSEKKRAYSDRALPIGYDQTISQPYIVALMTEALALKPGQKVLEIGTGSGYQAAVLSQIVDSVYTIEIVEELGLSAMQKLISLGYLNVQVKIGDGYEGWPRYAPYDGIVVTAAPDFIPPPLIDQLKDGGRMIIPVGPVHAVQSLLLVTKNDGKIEKEELIPVRFVPFTRE